MHPSRFKIQLEEEEYLLSVYPQLKHSPFLLPCLVQETECRIYHNLAVESNL